MSRKPRAVAYARVSTEEESQKTSYENQVEIYTDRILENPEWEYAGTYADPAITGTTGERPEFKRMMKDAEHHKFDIILCKSISRFARNTLLTVESIRKLQELDIKVIFEKENLDTSEPAAEMMLTIMSAFAQEESRNASERVKEGIRLRAANGSVTWNPLYGFRQDGDGDHAICEEEAEVVRRIFAEAEKGLSAAEIARGLNADGIGHSGSADWNRKRIGDMLKNERYAGDVLVGKSCTVDHLTHKRKKNDERENKYILQGHHEPIVSREQFDRVQKIRELKKDGSYPYGQKPTCPCCGGGLEFRRDFFGQKSNTWVCEADEFYIPAGKLNEAVMDAAHLAGHGFATAEFWWVDDLVKKITFGAHEGKDDRTVEVIWKDGETTSVPSGISSMKKLRYRRRLKDRKERTAKADLNVTRIPHEEDGGRSMEVIMEEQDAD